jgi:hypothetical protein
VPLPSGDSVRNWASDKTISHPMLPMARLAELFNVNHFVVSQVGGAP